MWTKFETEILLSFQDSPMRFWYHGIRWSLNLSLVETSVSLVLAKQCIVGTFNQRSVGRCRQRQHPRASFSFLKASPKSPHTSLWVEGMLAVEIMFCRCRHCCSFLFLFFVGVFAGLSLNQLWRCVVFDLVFLINQTKSTFLYEIAGAPALLTRFRQKRESCSWTAMHIYPSI